MHGWHNSSCELGPGQAISVEGTTTWPSTARGHATLAQKGLPPAYNMHLVSFWVILEVCSFILAWFCSWQCQGNSHEELCHPFNVGLIHILLSQCLLGSCFHSRMEPWVFWELKLNHILVCLGWLFSHGDFIELAWGSSIFFCHSAFLDHVFIPGWSHVFLGAEAESCSVPWLTLFTWGFHWISLRLIHILLSQCLLGSCFHSRVEPRFFGSWSWIMQCALADSFHMGMSLN